MLLQLAEYLTLHNLIIAPVKLKLLHCTASQYSCMQAHLGLLLLLCKCSIKGLAGGRAVIEGEAGRIWYCQGRIGGLNGHSMPHLHQLCLQQCSDNRSCTEYIMLGNCRQKVTAHDSLQTCTRQVQGLTALHHCQLCIFSNGHDMHAAL